MKKMPGNIEPTAPGWYVVRYVEFGSIEARYYDEQGWQVLPGYPSFFGDRPGDIWWDECHKGKVIPDWVKNLYAN